MAKYILGYKYQKDPNYKWYEVEMKCLDDNDAIKIGSDILKAQKDFDTGFYKIQKTTKDNPMFYSTDDERTIHKGNFSKGRVW